MAVEIPELPHLADSFTPAQHAAHTSPAGVQFFQHMTAQKAAGLLNKVATKGSSTGKPKPGTARGGKGKSRMSKANARTITAIARK